MRQLALAKEKIQDTYADNIKMQNLLKDRKIRYKQLNKHIRMMVNSKFTDLMSIRRHNGKIRVEDSKGDKDTAGKNFSFNSIFNILLKYLL